MPERCCVSRATASAKPSQAQLSARIDTSIALVVDCSSWVRRPRPMRSGAERRKSLRHSHGASSGFRVRQSGQSDFARCESRHSSPVGACSCPCERTQPVRCRALNAAARSLAHCRQRHRRSRWSIRTLFGVSGCPLPQCSGISIEALLRRRSALENGITAVLLVEITPPLPLSSAMSAIDPRGLIACPSLVSRAFQSVFVFTPSAPAIQVFIPTMGALDRRQLIVEFGHGHFASRWWECNGKQASA